jgi:hypothetical protein
MRTRKTRKKANSGEERDIDLNKREKYIQIERRDKKGKGSHTEYLPWLGFDSKGYYFYYFPYHLTDSQYSNGYWSPC